MTFPGILLQVDWSIRTDGRLALALRGDMAFLLALGGAAFAYCLARSLTLSEECSLVTARNNVSGPPVGAFAKNASSHSTFRAIGNALNARRRGSAVGAFDVKDRVSARRTVWCLRLPRMKAA